MVKCIYGEDKLKRMDKCHKCTMKDKIRGAVPNITDEEMTKMEIVISDYIQEGYNWGAQDAANDIGGRM